jgi:hypothetical protein
VAAAASAVSQLTAWTPGSHSFLLLKFGFYKKKFKQKQKDFEFYLNSRKLHINLQQYKINKKWNGKQVTIRLMYFLFIFQTKYIQCLFQQAVYTTFIRNSDQSKKYHF